LRRSGETDWAAAAIAWNGRQRGGRGAVAHDAILLACLLVRHKEEKLVLLDRPAKGAAELVRIQYRLRQTLEIADPVVRIQRAIAEEFERASVVAVGTGFR